MKSFLDHVNIPLFFIMVGIVLLFVCIFCVVMMIKSYRAGIEMGMEKEVLRKAIATSATFTVLPSVSILLGVIALSGSLGVPLSWLRLSVIGSLQYELNVAEIAAKGSGLSGLRLSEMNIEAFITIAIVMTIGILGGVLCCLFGLKKYDKVMKKKPKKAKAQSGKKSFGDVATIAMFIGLCCTYIASYIGTFAVYKNYMPLFVAGVSAIVMALFEYLIKYKKMEVLENFSVATSMLCGMVAAVVLSLMA